MSRFDALDLSQLPPPAFPEALSFEAILAERVADLVTRLAAVNITFDAEVESDPLIKMQQADSFRETLVRQRLNDAVRAVFLATAEGADLENVVADFNLVRRELIPADPETGAAAVMETDESLRQRRMLAVEALSTAGPAGAYIFHTLSAHVDVKDACVYAPEDEIEDPDNPAETLTGDGIVLVVVLSSQGDGAPSNAVLEAVEAQLKDDDVRPLTDHVVVRAAAINTYAVEGVIRVGRGPDANVVLQAAIARAEALAKAIHVVGAPMSRDLFEAACTIFGADGSPLTVEVDLAEPAADIEADPLAAPYCTGVTLTVEVLGD